MSDTRVALSPRPTPVDHLSITEGVAVRLVLTRTVEARCAACPPRSTCPRGTGTHRLCSRSCERA